MKDYLLLYQGGDPAWADTWTPEQMQAVMQDWQAWFKELEASGNLRNPGAALQPEGTALRRNGSGFATDTTMPEVKELIGGFTVIAAESLDAATEIAHGCPYLDCHPEARILVRPVMRPEDY